MAEDIIVTLLDGTKMPKSKVPIDTVFINENGEKVRKVIKNTSDKNSDKNNTIAGRFLSDIKGKGTLKNKLTQLAEQIDINEIKGSLIEQAQNATEKMKTAAVDAVETFTDKIEDLELDEKYEKAAAVMSEKVDEAKELARNISQRVAESEAFEKVVANYQKLIQSEAVTTTIDKASGAIQFVGDKFDIVIADERTQKVLSATVSTAQKTGKATVKGLRVISGVQAVQDRRKSLATKEEAELLKVEIETANEAIKDDLNETLEDFGSYKVLALKRTVGVFLDYLERMNQKSKSKEYEFLRAIDIKKEEIKEMEQVDMKASDAVKVLAVGGGFAAIGLMGVPALVTSAVTALCSASTGTAISALSGAAAHNAVLAWLGGGAIASGGGGMAAGAAVMTGITAGATIGLAVIAVGTLSSAFYAKKATEATQYLADIKVWAAETEKSWTVMDAIKARVIELHRVTEDLEERTVAQLSKLEPLVDQFNPQDMKSVEIFQQAAIFVKSMSELAQTPVLDEDGNFNEQANLIIAETEKILNKEL